MSLNPRKRGPYFKWTDTTKVPRQTLWSRAEKQTTQTGSRDDVGQENDSESMDTTELIQPTVSAESTSPSKTSPERQLHTGDSLASDDIDCADSTDEEDTTETIGLDQQTSDFDGPCDNGETRYADSEGSSGEDDNDSDSENIDHEGSDDVPLYSGSRLTIATSMLLILTFALRHGLTGSAIHDLLSLVELHCISENFCKSTVKLFHDFFSRMKKPMECHYFCQDCGNYLSTVQSSNCSLCSSTDIRYFITMPLATQLESILSKPNIKSTLEKRKKRKKSSSHDIEDVYDGNLYKSHFDEDGYFQGTACGGKSSQIHLSLQINTDGVSLFRTSRFGIWPLYGIINELPGSIRFNKENRLFMGLWFGDEKPQMNLFLTPMVKEINHLYHQGTQINDKTCRIIILSSVADAPARSLMLNCMQYNGFYGCGCCYAPGERKKVGESGGFSRVYPYDVSNECGHPEYRQHHETINHGESVDKEFNESKKKNATPKFGIKGSSVLRFLPLYDIVRGTTIDYMHCVFLGVTKMLLSSWFDVKNRKETWSLRKNIKVLSQRLVSIQPPNFIKRMPRPFEDLAHWKASEYRSFLLFFSYPVLIGIMDEEYLTHFMMLSQGIYILSSDIITEVGLQKARSLLKLFCSNMSGLYGSRFETFNVHCLLHLCDKVSDLGPLWAHSCFYFEGFNAELRLLFHGTQNIQEQIMRAVSIQQSIPDMVRTLTDLSPAKVLYEKMTSRRKITKLWSEIATNIFAIGKYTVIDLPLAMKSQISTGGATNTSCFKFLRLYLNGQVIQSECYTRVKRRHSYTISYDENNFGFVMYYIKSTQNDIDVRFFAVVKKLQVQSIQSANDNTDVKHVMVEETEILDAIPISSIKRMCLYINIAGDNAKYIIKCPNNIEID